MLFPAILTLSKRANQHQEDRAEQISPNMSLIVVYNISNVQITVELQVSKTPRLFCES